MTLLKMKEAEAQKDQCKQAIESLQPVLEARVRENAKLLAEISEREVGAEALRSDIALEQRRMDDVQTQIQHVDAKAREEMGAVSAPTRRMHSTARMWRRRLGGMVPS